MPWKQWRMHLFNRNFFIKNHLKIRGKFFGVFVLIWYFFGHHRTFLVCPCPMLARLRTQPRSFGFSLSEVSSTSDTTSLFWLFLVRCWLDFGHNLALLALPCPMLAQLRTQILSVHFKLINLPICTFMVPDGITSSHQTFITNSVQLSNTLHTINSNVVPVYLRELINESQHKD